jgi:RHS repeat-associated protein
MRSPSSLKNSSSLVHGGQIDHADKGSTDYRYDPIGRLIEAKGPMYRERFAFDPASNIVQAPPPGENERSGAVAARTESSLPPQVPKVLGNLLKEYAGTHFAYDARGNLVGKRTSAGQQRYEWDAFNRLTAAHVEEASRRSEARYFYDAFGRRIGKEVNGERTVFGWDGDTLAYESDERAATHYVYEAGSFVPLAQFVSAPVAGAETPVWKETDRYLPEEDPLQRVPQRRADAHVFYYHCDQIGTPLQMTDEDGEVVWEASYKAWGEAREVIARASKAAAGIVARNPIRFQGQQVDEESGLHYNRHRYYDTTTGRFISDDLIGLAGGFNLQQYAPNPILWVDPLGLRCDSPSQKLARKLRALQKAQDSAANVRTLPDGRVRYYDQEIPAARPGPTRGRSHVTEWNPQTGQVRAWEETYDQAGEVNRVHPKMNNGEVLDLPHYPPTKADIDQGKATASGRATCCRCP